MRDEYKIMVVGDNLLKKINEAGNRKENNPTPSQTKI